MVVLLARAPLKRPVWAGVCRVHLNVDVASFSVSNALMRLIVARSVAQHCDLKFPWVAAWRVPEGIINVLSVIAGRVECGFTLAWKLFS